MKKQFTKYLILSLLLAAGAAGCGDDNDSGNGDNGGGAPAATLAVAPETVVLGAEAGAWATFSVTTTAAWTATVSGEGFTLDRDAGTGDAVVRVTAPEANPADEPVTLGTVGIAATGVEGTKTVTVTRQAASVPGPSPDDVVITVDFAEGPGIATPALPASSAEALTGRHEYTIAGYPFAVYADAADKGKFFWTDNSQYYPMEEPYKGLYFSKTGAYIEFPALREKALAEIVYFYNNGAGEQPELDVTTAEEDFVASALEYAEDGSGMTYTLLEPVAGTAYRLTVPNRMNAQVSKLVLTYR